MKQDWCHRCFVSRQRITVRDVTRDWNNRPVVVSSERAKYLKLHIRYSHIWDYSVPFHDCLGWIENDCIVRQNYNQVKTLTLFMKMVARILNIIMLKQMWYVLRVIKRYNRTTNFNIYIATTGFEFPRFIMAVVLCYK